jgi:hypothetical protein
MTDEDRKWLFEEFEALANLVENDRGFSGSRADTDANIKRARKILGMPEDGL